MAVKEFCQETVHRNGKKNIKEFYNPLNSINSQGCGKPFVDRINAFIFLQVLSDSEQNNPQQNPR